MQRERYDMPDWVVQALREHQVRDDDPPYQRNDYIGWITRAKRKEAQKARVDQMVDELKQAGVDVGKDRKPGDA